MIFGAHAIIFSKLPQEARELLKNVLGSHSIDAGGGWLIFALPPAEIAIHPTDGATEHQIYLMCDDIEATITELRAKGIKFTKAVQDVSWGRVSAIALPGGGELGLYQPRHPTAFTRPAAASRAAGEEESCLKGLIPGGDCLPQRRLPRLWRFDGQADSTLGHRLALPLRGVCGLQDLEILHRLECAEEPVLVRIDIQAARLEGKEKLMSRLDRGEAPGGGLALDDETAGRGGFDRETGQAHEGRTLPHDRTGAMPRGVDEKDDEPASAGAKAGKLPSRTLIASSPGYSRTG